MLLLLLLPSLVAAHFEIKYPGTRGFNDEKHAEWPCGGFNTPSGNRSEFPLNGGPIQIESGHTQQLIQVLMSVGNNQDFSTVVIPTFLQTGPGDICFGSVAPPSDMNITAGTNATFQIITGTSHGGLYGCVDVTFTSDTLSSDEYSQNCKNNTALEVFQLKDSSGNANETSISDVEPVSGDVEIEDHDHGESESDSDSDSESSGDDTNGGYKLAMSGMLMLASGLVAAASLW